MVHRHTPTLCPIYCATVRCDASPRRWPGGAACTLCEQQAAWLGCSISTRKSEQRHLALIGASFAVTLGAGSIWADIEHVTAGYYGAAA